LPLNTMGPLDTRILEDVEPLRSVSSKDLRALGRLPYPMLRRRGDRGFHRISWDEALGIAARRIRATTPDRLAFFVTSRGMTNESYYVASKAARFLGTNHIDNSSRPCHSPSTTGLKETIGVAASTCSYTDWIGSDLIVFFGSDVPNNQPVATKYLDYAKKQGTKIAVVPPTGGDVRLRGHVRPSRDRRLRVEHGDHAPPLRRRQRPRDREPRPRRRDRGAPEVRAHADPRTQRGPGRLRDGRDPERIRPRV